MHEGHAKGHTAPDPGTLLSYMLEHNTLHTAELSGIADKLDAAGDQAAAALVREAAAVYEQGNEKLSEALQTL